MHLRIVFWFADRFAKPKAGIAVPPALLRYRVSESVSIPEFLRIGEGCAELIKYHLQSMGIDLASAGRVLDFGCGCGRTVRWLLGQGTAEVHGADVDAEAIEWCRKHLPGGHFHANRPEPPLPYPSEYFDAVYCVSVFTHLDEPMQDGWLAELKRVLKPGGVLLLTVHGTAAAKRLDPEGASTLENTGLVHRCSRKLKGFVPGWYQTTWHSQEYIVERLSGGFVEAEYRVLAGIQDIVVARKLFASPKYESRTRGPGFDIQHQRT